MFEILKHFRIIAFICLGSISGCSSPDSNFGMVRLDNAQSLNAPDIPASEVTFRIQPLKNVPGNHVDELIGSIFNQSMGTEFRINRQLEADTTHILKGTASAVGDSNGIIVIYSFKICKSDGGTVHSFGGQEYVGGTIEDPWSAVRLETIRRIAEHAVFEVNAWLSRA